MRDRAMVISLSLSLVVILLTSAAILRAHGRDPLPGLAVREPAPANLAQVDKTTTQRVNGVLGADFMRLFTYATDEPWQNQTTAGVLLTGAAVGEYQRSVQAVQAQALGQRVVLTTGVLESALSSLTDRSAQEILVANQQLTKANGQTTTTTATLSLTAVAAGGGNWLISDIRQQPTTPRPAVTPPSPDDDAEQATAKLRDQVLSAAEHAAEVLYTMDYTNAAAGLASWRSVATGYLLDSWDDLPGLINRIQTAEMRTTATADAAALADLGSNTAYVLVLLRIKTPGGDPDPPQTAIFLSMDDIPGKWLVDADQKIPG